jgi:hypothetical protein
MNKVRICMANVSAAGAIAEIHLSARKEAMPYLARPHSDEEVRG